MQATKSQSKSSEVTTLLASVTDTPNGLPDALRRFLKFFKKVT
jgi:hypothetical protein